MFGTLRFIHKISIQSLYFNKQENLFKFLLLVSKNGQAGVSKFWKRTKNVKCCIVQQPIRGYFVPCKPILSIVTVVWLNIRRCTLVPFRMVRCWAYGQRMTIDDEAHFSHMRIRCLRGVRCLSASINKWKGRKIERRCARKVRCAKQGWTLRHSPPIPPTTIQTILLQKFTSPFTSAKSRVAGHI